MKPSVLITGASTGIGAVYADRFAKRGHDLVLVARDKARMEALASRLRRETGVSVDILPADLTDTRDLAPVEARLRDDHQIGILINNAGTALPGGFVDQTPEDAARIVKEHMPWSTPLAALLRAGVAATQGDAARAQARTVLNELLTAERREEIAAIRGGDGYQTLWERPR